MKTRIPFATLAAIAAGVLPMSASGDVPAPVAIAIHAGAGTITRDRMDAGTEQRIRAALESAVDAGHEVLAAGGTTNKRWGRVGDSPIIGAGTYADNRSCAVSATGHGEYFIRATVARDICARVQYLGATVEQAAREVVQGQLVDMGGEGGVIAIDREGDIALVANTPGMYRASIDRAGNRFVGIFMENEP